MTRSTGNEPVPGRGRRLLVLALFAMGAVVLLARAVDLQVMRKDFLQAQGDARYLRVVTMPAHRGMITDRHGEPLAISTPVDSVWANPSRLLEAAGERIRELAGVLDLDADALQRRLEARAQRRFVYIERHVKPSVGQRVESLELPGVALQREFQRYYPTGEVTAHVLGFTNIDDVGQEGLELAYDQWLRGTPGAKRVVKDRLGRVVEEVELIKSSEPGKDLRLSIDRRLQYLAYRALKAAVVKHKARAGSAVIVDVRTGEILAMVNQPSFNPNTRQGLKGSRYRNRAMTDVFEPGSTIKPFTIAAALASGRYDPDSMVNTNPGVFKVGHDTVRDHRNYGRIDVATVIAKSSNVGASKIALSLEPNRLWSMFDRLGLAERTVTGFPGEARGFLDHYSSWARIERATLSFGYGLSVSTVQLARAYAALADGRLRPLSLLPVEDPPRGERIMDAALARKVRRMLEGVVTPEGTGSRAAVPGYRVAGKTGTVRKAVDGGYAEDRYVALFAGLAPASRPRLAMVVAVDEPRAGDYYGGLVAAPVFSEVMNGALRLMAVPPDDLPEGDSEALVAQAAGNPEGKP